MLRLEEELERVKNENSLLGEASQQAGTTTAQLNEQLHQLELDLTISQEKHRTCQKEVSLF